MLIIPVQAKIQMSFRRILIFDRSFISTVRENTTKATVILIAEICSASSPCPENVFMKILITPQRIPANNTEATGFIV